MQWILWVLAASACMVLFFIWQNSSIVITRMVLEDKKIPGACNGKRILQVSDLHDAAFGKENNRLLRMIKKETPDWIVVTGDVYDRRRPNLKRSCDFLEKACKIAPVFYVTGNHENWSGLFPEFYEKIKEKGPILLEDRAESLFREKDGRELILYGLWDHSVNRQQAGNIMDPAQGRKENARRMETTLKKMKQQKEQSRSDREPFRILLSHRPEHLETYSALDFDLVFAGHAHGGQIRLPLVGGLYAPSQGWLPAYTSGMHINKETKMIVSRGLGNSQMPLRICNRPEIVVVTLQSAPTA